jgi:hypothetical protein
VASKKDRKEYKKGDVLIHTHVGICTFLDYKINSTKGEIYVEYEEDDRLKSGFDEPEYFIRATPLIKELL